MLTFQNYREYLASCTDIRSNSHIPPAKPYQWVCADCGQTFSDETKYGLWSSDDMVCYACCTARDRQAMKTYDCFTGYLSSDGKQFTTWSGGLLGHVIDSRPCKPTRMSFTHDRESYLSVRVRDVHGREWYGCGSNGMVITLRACKGTAE